MSSNTGGFSITTMIIQFINITTYYQALQLYYLMIHSSIAIIPSVAELKQFKYVVNYYQVLSLYCYLLSSFFLNHNIEQTFQYVILIDNDIICLLLSYFICFIVYMCVSPLCGG
jgi:hypothetical protein